MVGLFLAFPFGCWGIYGGRRGGGAFFFAFRFAFSLKEGNVVVTEWKIGALEVSGGGTGTLGE